MFAGFTEGASERSVQTDRHVFRNGRIFADRQTGQGAIDHFAERIEIVGGIGLSLAGEQFRRHESGGADQRTFAIQSNQPNIGERGTSVHPEDVVRLDVPVDQTVLVQFLQTREQTVQHGRDLLAVHPPKFVQPVGERVCQIFALTVIEVVSGVHDAADPFPGDFDKADIEQVRMAAVLVISEAREFAFGITALIGDDLDSHPGAGGIHIGEPDFAVSAPPGFLTQRAAADLIAALIFHNARVPV